MNTEQKYYQVLKNNFNLTTFRPGQEKAIQSILSGRDTFLIMPTGGGKSLCYQLPSLVFPHLTLVISPLISLMKDQVDKLQGLGIQASFINSSLPDFEVKERMRAMHQNKFDLVYIAPERFYSEEFNRKLFDLDISMVAIDEAHCVSTWGHDFRPSYLKIKQIIQKFKKRPIISAFTATATPYVQKDVVKELEMQNPLILVTGFDRPNLTYQTVQSYNDHQKLEILTNYLRQRRAVPGIIYAGTRKNVESISGILSRWDIPNLPYHAGMQDEVRKIHQEKFMAEEAPLIVATNAFGMGIDKKNLRFVIHFNMPGSLEAYYQEAGRAGRDNAPADCLLFYSPYDRNLQEFFIESSHPSRATIENVYQILDEQNQLEILLTYEEINKRLPNSTGAMAVSAAVKILEKYNLVGRMSNEEHPAFAKLLVPKEMVFDLVGRRAKIQSLLLETLLAIFPNQLRRGREVELSYLAKRSGLAGEQITRAFKSLQDRGILEYSPPFRGYGVKMLKPNLNKKELGIDFQKIREELEYEMQKLDIMESYIFSEDCRRKFILDYFGDSKKIDSCNNCDVCGTQNKSIDGYNRQEPEDKIIYF